MTNLNNTKRVLLISGSALALAFGLAPLLANAQTPSNEPFIGKTLKASGMSVSAMPVSRNWDQIEATQRQMDLQHRAPQAETAPRPTMGEAAYRAAKAAADAVRATGVKPGAPPPPAAPAIIIVNKPGPNAAGAGNGYYPPDSNGAIGATQVVMPVNLSMNVYKRGGKLLKSSTFNAFLNTTDALSDPRVLWDPIWSRWVVSIIVVPTAATDSPACYWVGASKTSSATGAWWLYRVCSTGGLFAAGDLWDYDQLGMTQDGLILTGNLFPWTGSFKGPVVESLSKAVIYNGQGFGTPAYFGGSSMGTIAPPRVLDNNPNAYLIAANGTAGFELIRGSNLENGYYGTYTLMAAISSPYTIPPGAAQPGTTAVLDTLDGRFQAPGTQYSNYLWAVHTETLGGLPAPRYFQIDTNANSIVQSGFFYASGTSYDWNPSIAATTAGNAFVTWSSTDPAANLNAQVRISGRQAADAAGAIGAGSVLFQSSVALTGDTQGSVQRWGDYSMTSLDPVSSTCGAGERAAVFNETIVNANEWGVQFGLIGFCK